MAGGWVSLRSWSCCYSRSLCCLVVVMAVLAACSRAQDSMGDMPTVSIRMATDRRRTTAIIPGSIRAEGAIYIIGNESFSIVNSNPPNITASFSCEESNCTMTLRSEMDMMEMSVDPLVVTFSFNTSQSLVLTIRENLTDSCKEYSVPKLFSQADEPYVFICEPLENATQVEEVVWRRFDDLDDVVMFQETGRDFDDKKISTGGNFTLDRDKNIRLRVKRSMTSEPENIVFYYVPSFRMMGEERERVTAETLVFVGPMITTEPREFSIDIVFGGEDAMNFTTIACESETFPAASVSWELTNTEFPDGVDLLEYEGFNSTVFLLDSPSRSMFRTVRNAIVQLKDPRYEDDGVFNCTVDNGVNVVSRTVRLRIKSRFRPLWPTVGIFGVFIMVALLMLTFFTVEKIIEKKKKHKYVEGSSNHADGQRLSSVSSAGGQADNKGKKHSAVKRLSSNRPLIDESTL